MIITVDCGTTNLRARLFDGRRMLHEVKHKTGSRLTAFDGHCHALEESLAAAIRELLDMASLCESDIEIIVSSGTLASDVGIIGIPHAVAPCGIRESAAAARFARFPEITGIPFLFIPGVKTLPSTAITDPERKIEIWDSMSGEECETYGIMEVTGLTGDFVITLPGSYNKVVTVSADGQIISIGTGMCGEFIAAMSEHTLLKKSLPSPVIQRVIPEKLLQGYDYCARHGVSPTLIKTRNVQVHGDFTVDEAANFFVGAILYDDIRSVLQYRPADKPLLVGGSNPLREIFMILLRHAGAENLIEVDDDTARIASSLGAMRVYREKLRAEELHTGT